MTIRDIQKVDDHTKKALERIAYQYQGLSRFEKLISALISGKQDFEDNVHPFLTDRWIDSADGDQLDGLGELVGEDRNGRLDGDYRRAIRLRAVLNAVSGQPEGVIGYLRAYSGSERIKYKESYPATVEVFVDGDNVDAEVVRSVRDILPSGVALYASTAPSLDTKLPFGFSEEVGEGNYYVIKTYDGSLISISDNALLGGGGQDEANIVKSDDVGGFSEQMPEPFILSSGHRLKFSDGSLTSVTDQEDPNIQTINTSGVLAEDISAETN